MIPTVSNIISESSAASSSIPFYRNHTDAMLYACQQQYSTDECKEKTLFILDTLNLQPFRINDGNNLEQNALAHVNVIKKLTSESEDFQSILPVKRKHELDDYRCKNCTLIPPPHLEKVLSLSPYFKALTTRRYTELSKELCTLLNDDWDLRPQTKFFCAQLFAGAILFNKNNGESILINGVEVYGRTGPVDAHREHFGLIKNTTISTSLPPPISTTYEDVWPVTVNSSEGYRLTIGTQTCNLLVTSSLRLDKTIPPSLGATTNNFLLFSKKDSLSTVIYLDEESIKKALNLSKNSNTNYLSNSNFLFQLRQLRTKFNSLSTYYLCRASGPFTKTHINQPYTIFTLSGFDNGQNGNGNCGSKLLRRIALNVLAMGESATLDYEYVLSIQKKSNGKMLEIFNDILSDFSSTSSTIKIISNNQLNNHLEKIAILISPYITTANKSVSTSIMDIFSSF